MIYLLLSITASLVIFIIFKLLQKFEVNTFQTIVVNYIVAFGFGIMADQSTKGVSGVIEAKWFLGSVVVGAMFIGLFTLMARTAQKNGLSVVSVASKMSVIIPIIFGILLYGEGLGHQKLAGIILALVSVYLVSVKSKTSVNFKKNLLLPVLLFFGSGISDTYINHLQNTAISEENIPLFSACVFGFAGVIGIFILAFQKIKYNTQFDLKSILGGILLGLANYASLFYVIKALQVKNIESSTFFTLNNVSIVMASTLIGLLVFKEHLTKKNWMGIGTALIAIYLVSFA